MPDFDPEKAAARADLCRLLAACYYEPDPEFVEERVFDSMLDAAVRIHPDLAQHARRLGSAFGAESGEDLLVDYTRLFLGPASAVAKPYGSVWLEPDKGLLQDSTMAVVELYAEGGFEISDEFRELPDHIAAELEFLYLLLVKEAQAHWTREAEALATVAGLRQRFLARHLGAWVGPFTAAICTGARSTFYRELAEFTERFVRMESDA